MKYTRWYDKNERLKMVMETLEKIDPETKVSVAVDLIQMILDEKCPDTDNFIDEMNEEYIPIRRRWYDKSETLHSAVEMLKHIDCDDRKDLLQEIVHSIIYFKRSDDE